MSTLRILFNDLMFYKVNKELINSKFIKLRNMILLSFLIILVVEILLIVVVLIYMMSLNSYIAEQTDIKYSGKSEATALSEKLVYKGESDNLYFRCYFPIADNHNMSYGNSFGTGRSYGNGGVTVSRKHEGIDIFCKEGTPIIAVESGVVEKIGWNELGGWRINILSEDGSRAWYYAHMRKSIPM